MAERSATQLSELRDEQSDLAAKLTAQLQEIALTGKGHEEGVREKRDAARSRAEELEAARVIAEKRSDDRARAVSAKAQQDASAAAAKARSEVIQKAEFVDACLLALEAAQEDLRLSAIDFGAASRKAGQGDGGRLMNGLLHGTRWATYHHAPTFASDAQVARVEMNRRRSLAETVSNLMPTISLEA